MKNLKRRTRDNTFVDNRVPFRRCKSLSSLPSSSLLVHGILGTSTTLTSSFEPPGTKGLVRVPLHSPEQLRSVHPSTTFFQLLDHFRHFHVSPVGAHDHEDSLSHLCHLHLIWLHWRRAGKTTRHNGQRSGGCGKNRSVDFCSRSRDDSALAGVAPRRPRQNALSERT